MKLQTLIFFFLAVPALGFPIISGTVFAAGPDGSPVLLAGVGRSEITPEPGGPMCGYGDRGNLPSVGIHDRLYCRSLFLQQESLRIALVSCDMLVYTPELREAVMERIAGAKVDHVMLAATHTHSGPGGYKKGWLIGRLVMGTYSEAMFDFLADRIAEAVVASSRRLRPATVGSGTGAAPELIRNRRHEGGPTDPEVGLLRVDGRDGAPLALVVNFAAHPTVLSPENLDYSGDYAGLTARRIEEATGAVVLFFIGANGDQGPCCPGYGEWDEDHERQIEQAEAIARALSEETLRIMDFIDTSSCRTLETAHRLVDLPRVNLRASCFKYVFAPLLRLLFHGIFYGETVFQAVRINDLVMVGVPAEISSAIGGKIKEEHGRGRTMVVGLANDGVGYVLEEEDYGTGGYEACMSFYGAEFDGFIVDQVRATVDVLGSVPTLPAD